MFDSEIAVGIIGLVTGAILSLVGTGILIPILKKHQLKQFVREEGPKSHLTKTGTPSMGGLAFGLATVIGSIIVMLITNSFTLNGVVILITGLAFGLIGFIDDYEKAIKKNNAGISPKQKIVLQFTFALLFALWAYFHSGHYEYAFKTAESPFLHSVWIPIWNNYLNLGIFYIVWVIFVMISFSNAVNLTDGLDGLASSVTVVVSIFMVFGGILMGYMEYPIIMGVLAGSLIGFLFYNHYPAKIFMGDTGSMMLGGLLAATGILMKIEIALAIAGLIYVMEALSVIIQVLYFKKTGGKRFFKMAPLHHHFELSGLHETKVVMMFVAITVVLCVLSYLMLTV